MTDNDEHRAEGHINFDVLAVLRKWPSLNNQRLTEAAAPYSVYDGTLDGCLREFITKPATARHLYEIHISPQPPLVANVLVGEMVTELARLRDFL